MKLLTLSMVVVIAFASCTRRPVQQDAPVNRIPMDHSNMDHGKMESSPGAAEAPYDLQFLDTMVMHHQGAIDAAQMVATRAQHDQLKDLARSIIADQQREISQMKEWRAAWYGDKPPAVNMELPGMREGMHGMDVGKLDSLKGKEFDLEFIRQMVPHHEGAVTMAQDVLGKTDRAELKTLADNIVRSQSDEIERMTTWRDGWEPKE